MRARCQCRFVSFELPTPEPLDIYICHCLECRAQSASAFGVSAKFPRFDLPQTEPPLGCYTRGTDSGGVLDCFFCPKCGTRLVHARRGGPTMNVKAGSLDDLDWTRARKHIWCRSAVVPIPEGVERWDKEPTG